jgi:hypothetical protein
MSHIIGAAPANVTVATVISSAQLCGAVTETNSGMRSSSEKIDGDGLRFGGTCETGQ